MRESRQPLGRRDMMRAGVGVMAAATVAQPVSAQEDPYDGWFDDTDNYEGTVDFSGQETVELTVGAGENGLLFDPAAIQVDPGTTVVWEWTGEGGGHNVTAEDGSFESETVGESGHTFEHTFGEDTDGEIFRYVCTPHESLGMVGAVAVGDVVETIQGEGDEESAEGGAGDGGSSIGPLSTQGILATFGGVLALGLLSPLIFALVMKYVYKDDKPTQETTEYRP